MQRGDIVTVHNTPANIAEGMSASGVGVLQAEDGPGVWSMWAFFSPGSAFPLSGVPQGTEPSDFFAWEPRHAGASTPVLVAGENVGGMTALPCFWTVHGGVVTVHGALNVQAAAPGDPVKVRIPLPIPSQLTSPGELAGVASAPGATLQAHASDVAELNVPTGPGSSTLITYSFAYRIIA